MNIPISYNWLRAHFEKDMTEADIILPYSRGDLSAEVHRIMRVLKESHTDDGITLKVRAYSEAIAGILRKLN